MRNLKRALSLTLASVMLLGMMVVGSSAAAGYDDVAETDNVEAIEVLQAVQVMVGDERGFGPERPVNRAEMAVVMGKLLNLDYNYYEAICPFNDVYDWARGWVGACYANGIVSGRGEGVYDPGTTVTAVEAASMLMRALGYFKYQSDYSAGFETATVLQANKIRLFDGVDSTVNAPLTRNQVAQMALNALKTGMVEPDGNTLNFIDTNGNIIASGGKVNYVNVTSNKAFATAIDDVKASSMGSANDAPIVELGEQLYNGDLKLRDDIDAFGRPSRHWEYDAKEIGTYVKKELIKEEYTVKVTGRTLHDLLGSTTLKDYDLDVYIDGVEDPDINPAVFGKTSLVRTNDVGVGATGKGVLTQVFLDADAKLITIAVINTYLAIADEDFDDRTDDVNVTVYGIQKKTVANQYSEYVKNAKNDDGTSANQNEGFKLETEDFPEIVDVKDGDAFLVNVADGEVQTLGKPEILSSAQITSFKQADWLVTGGTQYDFASAAEYECETLYDYTITGTGVINLKDINYDIYLDQFGYAIGVKEVDRVDNYLFITGLDTNTNNRYAVQADASAIFLDGTMESIKVDMKAARDLNDQTYNALTNGEKGGSLVNKWFSYTVGSNGIYEVVLVGDETTVEKTRAGQFRTLSSDETANIANDGHETYFNKELIEYYNKSLDGIVTGLGGSHGVDEISRKSIALRGADAPNSTWYSVYGDDKSVYITAELKTIQDAHGEQTIVNVIGGVDNVAVGIDEASIDVYTKAEALKKDRGANVSSPATRTAHGSYVLYDKDGDIIAAVVVGEDAGSVTNLVYTHKERIESETDNNASGSGSKANSVKGDYTWTRKVVSDGEEILLTEVGSGLSKLKNMLPYTWYVVKYNAKGEVKNVYPAWDTDASYGAYYGNGYKGMISDPTGKENPNTVRLEDKYVNNIEELNQATNENSMVLYEVGQYNTGRKINGAIVRSEWDGAAVGSINWLGGPNTEIVDNLRKSGKPQVDNHTLYITTDTNESLHRGFRVADDVKTVFIQKNNNDWTTTFESGYSRLERVINRLHDHDETGAWANSAERNYYHYEISAVMNNGKATVIVIRDLNNAGATITAPERSYNLKLYGNLFTSPNTVTGASNTVVMANDVEVKPTTTGNDSKGNYTVYSIPQGAMVGITDYDIDAAGVIFGCIYNYEIENLQLRAWQRTITFNMPAHESWIIGGTSAYFTGNTVGTVTRANVPVNTVVTFDGQPVNSKIPGKGIEDKIEIKISGLEPSTEYTVTLGDPAKTVKDTTDAAGNFPAFDYELTGNDIYNGYVNVAEIKATGNVGPVDRQVTIPAGVTVSYTKDGATVTVDGPKTAAIPDGTAITITVTEAGKKAQIGGVDVANPYTVNGNVIITLADKGEGDEYTLTISANKDGVALTSDNCDITVNGAAAENGQKVALGDTIVFEPANVLSVTGVDANGKVTGDVTIAPKDGYHWMLGGWWDETWTFVPTGAASLTRFSLARMASTPGWVEIVTTEGSCGVVTEVNGVEYTWTLSMANGKISLRPPAEIANNSELINACAAKFSGTEDVDYRFESKEDLAPDGRTGAIEAVMKATLGTNYQKFTATFTEYCGPDKTVKPDNIKKEEVADALNRSEEAKARGLSFTADKVDLTNKTATASTGEVATLTFDNGIVPTQVWKIVYPGGEVYVKDTTETTVKNVKDGVVYLIKADTVSGSAKAVDVEKHTAALIGGTSKDAAYVPAMKIKGLSNGAVVDANYDEVFLAEVEPDGDGERAKIEATGIQVGAKIYFTKASSLDLAEGQKVSLIVNGDKDNKITFTADENGEFAEQYIVVDGWNANDSKYQMTLEAVIESTSITVNLDGVPMDVDEDGKVKLVGLNTDKTLVYWDATNKEYKDISSVLTDVGSNGVKKVELTSIKAAKDETGVYNLYLAWKVTPNSGSNPSATGYKKLNAFGTDVGATADKITAATYYLPGESIYVQGKANSQLGTLEDGVATQIDKLPGVKVVKAVNKSPTVDSQNKAVWMVPVNDNINLADFKALVTFGDGMYKVESTSGLTANTAETFTVNGTKTAVKFESGVTVESFTFTPNAENEALEEVQLIGEVTLSTAKTGLTFKVTADKDVSAPSAEKLIGVFEITLSDGTSFKVDAVMKNS